MNCPCCGHAEFLPAFSIEEWVGEWVEVGYETCGACGLTRKLGSRLDLESYYRDRWQTGVSLPASGAADWLAPELLGHIDRAVDVGSRGPVLFKALRELGVDIYSDSTIGPDAEIDFWLGEGYTGPRFDLVTCRHVLEHVPDPDLAMKDLAAMAGRWVYIEVPSPHKELNRVLCGLDDLVPPHLFHFSIGSLAALVQRHGMFPVKLGWIGGTNPSNVVLARKNMGIIARHDMRNLLDATRYSYRRVATRINEEDASRVGLYGASTSYAGLLRSKTSLSRFRVFDRHRAGESVCGVSVEHPDAIDLPRVFLTPRMAQSCEEIEKDLAESHPELLVERIWP